MQETTIESIVVEYAEKRGVLVRKVAYLGRRGAPDRIFMFAGIVAFVEFKRPGRKPDRLQSKEIERMQRRGVVVAVIDDIARGKEWIDATFFRQPAR